MQIVQPLSYCNPVMDVRRLLLMYCTMYTTVPPFVEYRFAEIYVTRSATTVLHWYRYGPSTRLHISMLTLSLLSPGYTTITIYYIIGVLVHLPSYVHMLTYVQVYMCGATVPANFQLTSRTNTLTVKFHSDSVTTKPGFRAVLVGKFPKQNHTSELYLQVSFQYKTRIQSCTCRLVYNPRFQIFNCG